MSIKTLIVDDESVAREVLHSYIDKYCPQLEIIDEADHAQSAIEKILQHKPELVFLDVEMPFGNAFDVLEATHTQSYEVIFVTAFSQYSLQALNMSASYYILKPVSIEELMKAVEKIRLKIEDKNSINSSQILLDNLKQKPENQQIVLPTQSGFDVVKINEIIRLQADGNFTQIYFKDGKKQMVCRFLKHFEALLPHPFLRIHRSHIINLQCLQSYHKGSGGVVIMNDGYEVEVSPTYKKQLLEYYSV